MNFMLNKKLKIITPSIRKRSFDNIEHSVSNIEFKGKKTVFVGISGGQASGKKQISQYFHKHIKRSDTICEMSFLNQEKKREIFQKKMNISLKTMITIVKKEDYI